MFQPTNLKLWKHPDNYIGKNWPDYYVFLGQHRDSDCLERSNFECGLDQIGGEFTADNNDETPLVIIVRENHWAVGWVEWIAIHKSAQKQLELADQVIEKINDYPILDENHYCELEQNEANEIWNNCFDWRERIEYMRERPDEFYTTDFADLLSCARGKYFLGYASELITY